MYSSVAQIVGRLKAILGHKGHVIEDGINLRPWFITFVVYLVGLACVSIIAMQCDDGAGRMAHNVWLLALYLFYMSLCCSFFPGPTAWIVLLMASPVFGLIDTAVIERWFHVSGSDGLWLTAAVTVLTVASVGALGTMMANLNEYHILTFMLRFGKVNKIKETSLYQVASRYFQMNPFGLMVAVNFLPIPIDVVRWLAVTHGYRRDYFAWASFLGRLLRYGLFAAAAFYLEIGKVGVIAIQAAMVGLVFLRYVPKLLRVKS